MYLLKYYIVLLDRGYNSALDLEKEVPPYIKLSDQILNENSISCDGNDFNYNMRLIKQGV